MTHEMEMVMSFKKFTVPVKTEHVSFELAGETFHCRSNVAAGAMIALATLSDNGDDDKKGGKTLKALLSFFEAALMKEDYKRFMEALNDPEREIPLDMIGDIAGWIAGETTGRPTGEDSSGTPANVSSGDASTENSSHAELTYFRSQLTEPATS